MKRKLVLSLVALCGGLTIVGSGFSAWYFSIDALKATNSINHYVTDLNDSIGTLTDLNKDEKLYVILDQGDYENMKVETKGISINNVTDTVSDSNLGNEVATIGANYALTKEAATKLVAAGVTEGKFTATMELSTAAAKYIKFKTSYNGGSSLPTSTVTGDGITVADAKISYTYTVSFADHTSSDYSVDFKFDSSTTDKVNAMLQYNGIDTTGTETGKPTTKNLYDLMKTNIGSDPIVTITYGFAATLPTLK